MHSDDKGKRAFFMVFDESEHGLKKVSACCGFIDGGIFRLHAYYFTLPKGALGYQNQRGYYRKDKE